jgi:hypothetical protein
MLVLRQAGLSVPERRPLTAWLPELWDTSVVAAESSSMCFPCLPAGIKDRPLACPTCRQHVHGFHAPSDIKAVANALLQHSRAPHVAT